MKKTTFNISFDEDKASVLVLYLSQKGATIETELEKALDTLYAKTVPVGVREYIELRSGNAPTPAAPKPRKPKPPKTVEDKLTEAFDTLYQEYVPDEQRASIEARIEREDAAEQARLEADRRFAVYHIRENGDDCHFTSDIFRTPMQAAYRYRLYDRGELSADPETLAAAFIETRPINLQAFGAACADSRITALIEFDLDEGCVSICDSGDNEWQTYTLHDFSVAAYKAFRSDYRSEECRREIFNCSLAGKEVELPDETLDETDAPTMQM